MSRSFAPLYSPCRPIRRISLIETAVSAGSLYSSWSLGYSAGFHGFHQEFIDFMTFYDGFHRNQNLTSEIRWWALKEFCLFGTKRFSRQEMIWRREVSTTGKFREHTLTTVFVDTRPSNTEHPRKRFHNFRQSYMLSTDRIEIHQPQPASMTQRRSEGHTNGCDWWISIRSVDNTQDFR